MAKGCGLYRCFTGSLRREVAGSLSNCIAGSLARLGVAESCAGSLGRWVAGSLCACRGDGSPCGEHINKLSSWLW